LAKKSARRAGGGDHLNAKEPLPAAELFCVLKRGGDSPTN